MKKIRSSKIEYEVYSYLNDEYLENHRQQMIADGWLDESWNDDNDTEYDANDLGYITIRYRKEITL
ncbi:hypothetical protein [Paenibacillus polymyxa]|uniref:hypothetical protein n=1 Tax=Paenibacillus polymyxa TaxID=1406 RepID=UPI002AB42033|nr:hypothetical protein [Paenibacillus polymyxa]MDY8021202.1 hypothetical protein [Paenibacillus polymyxa]